MTPIDEVERLFRQLVDVLSQSDPDKLRSPIQVSELYQKILPYRHYRAALGFDTNEDYEMALLRFFAGEGGFASIDPPEVQEALDEEARAVNPDPGAFREFAAAKVYLNSGAVRTVTEAHEAYAPPPDDEDESEAPQLPLDDGDGASPPSRKARDEVEEDDAADPEGEEETDEPVEEAPPTPVATSPTAPATPSCPYCDRDLPNHRDVAYCPYCGRDLTMIPCPSCGTDLELDWRYCISCGDTVD